MAGRKQEWAVFITMTGYWALNIYQSVQPTNELRMRGAWGSFLIILPIITLLLSISLIPVTALVLAKDGGGWRNRSVVFWLAQVACWSFPIVVLGLIALLFLAVAVGVRV